MTLQPDPQAEALIFDIDGTVLDTLDVHYQAWRETVAPYGIDMTRELFFSVAGQTSRSIAGELNRRFHTAMDPDVVTMAKDQAYIRHAPRIHPFPAILELVHDAQGKYPVAAATNENFGVSNIVLRTCGLSSLFQVLVTADDVERPKPAPDVFLESARRLGVAPTKCHVFEDSPVGLAAAKAAGMIITDVKPYL